MLPPPVQAYFDAYTLHQPSLLDQALAPTFVGHVNGRDHLGMAEAKQDVADFLAAFPDCAYHVQDGVREADRVVVHWEVTGTHRGVFGDRRASGRAIKLAGLTLFRVVNGRIAELWSHWDSAGLLLQIELP